MTTSSLTIGTATRTLHRKLANSEFHLTPAEVGQIIGAARNRRDKLLILIFAYTGIRRAEARMIRKDDVELDSMRLIIRRGKGGKLRLVYLPIEVVRELRAYIATHPHPFLFTGRAGEPMSLRNVNYILSKTARRAGVTTPNPKYRNVGPHLLRHTFARNWKRVGGSLESLQKILGHSSLKTTLDIYGTESQLDVEANYQQVIRLISPETSHF